MEKIKCETVDFAAENAAKLIKLFPECEGERGMVDLDKLRQVLSSSVVDGDVERYQFTWPGKRKAMAAANAATTKTLRPAISESVGRDGTAGKFDSENLYIEGDNLEALKLLQCNYAGKVKMIYIDPPYNTGHDFVYRDRFSLTDKELAKLGGAVASLGDGFQTGLTGLTGLGNNPDNLVNPVSKNTEGLYVRNDSAEARYHSNWCSMMYPRLKLARNLLRDDGVLFMSIDDNEVVNARKLCDEVFGEAQFVAQLVWEKKKKGAFLSKSYISMKEYVLAYCYSSNGFGGLVGEINREEGNYPCIKTTNAQGIRKIPRGTSSKYREKVYKIDAGTRVSAGNMELTYLDDLVVKDGILQSDVRIDAHWIYGQDKIDEFARNGELYITQDNYIRRVVSGERVKLLKDLLLRVGADGESLSRYKFDENLNNGGWGTNEDANEEIHELFGIQYLFDFSKPSRLIAKLVQTIQDKNSLVLDFFSGSATTAHAVMQLNAEDGGNRKFILVQLPEVCAEDSEAAKAGYKNICEIGKERIRRAGKKIVDELAAKNTKVAKEVNESTPDLFRQDLQDSQDLGGGDNLVNPVNPVQNNSNIDVGFRVLKIDSSSLNDVSATVGETNQMMFDKLERIKSDRTPEDILFQLLIETHIPLSDPIAKVKVGGNEVFFVGVEADDFRQDLQDSQDLGSGDNPVNPVNPVQNIYMGAPLVACLDRSAKLTNEFFLELAAFKPGIAFFRDDAFNDDAARINVEQIFKQNSSNTIIKVI